MIQLSRKQSVLFALGVLTAFFLITMGIVARSRDIQEDAIEEADSPAKASLPSELTDNSEFVLDNFQRKEVQGEHTIWEVRATRGRYSPALGRAVLEQATLWLFDKEGGKTRIEAKNAVLFLQATSLNRAELEGSVSILKNDELLIETENAVYDKEQDTVKAPGPVKISSQSSLVTGIGMEVVVSGKDVKILDQVRTTVKSAEKT